MTSYHARGLRPAAPLRCLVSEITLDLTPYAPTMVLAADSDTRSDLLGLLSGGRRIGSGRLLLRDGTDELDVSLLSARDLAWLRRHQIAVGGGVLPVSPAATAVAATRILAGVDEATARAWIARVGAQDWADERLGTVRGPQRRLVGLAAALAGRARVLLLDLTGVASRPLWELLEDRAGSGTAVLGLVAAALPGLPRPTAELTPEGHLR